MSPPRVLTIAGSDPSGGAGLQADLKTFHAFGCYGMAAVTALTAQCTTGVSAVHAPPAAFLEQQLAAVLGDCPPAATKTGMLHDADVVRVVARHAHARALGRLVVDPVMVATSGDRLLAPEAERAVLDLLLPAAEVVTPNLHELAVLAGRPVADLDAAVAAARSLVAGGVRAVLVKGGHGARDDVAVDVLVRAGVPDVRMSRPRIALPATHGTGCTLSAALAAALALGQPLADAVRTAGDFVHRGLAAAFPVGEGAVPVNHLVRAVGGADA